MSGLWRRLCRWWLAVQARAAGRLRVHEPAGTYYEPEHSDETAADTGTVSG